MTHTLLLIPSSCSTAKIGSHVIAKNRNPANEIPVNFMPSYRKTPHKSGYRKTNCKNRIVFANFILFWVPCISRSREVGLLWKPIVSIWKLESSSFLQIWLDHRMGISNMYNITTRQFVGPQFVGCKIPMSGCKFITPVHCWGRSGCIPR